MFRNNTAICHSSDIVNLSVPLSICLKKSFISYHSIYSVICPLFRSGYGVCRVDKNTQSGWGRSTSAFHAHCGGDSVFDRSSPDSLLQTGQHGGTVAASLKH